MVVDARAVRRDGDVETRDGRRGHGFGSMPMGNAWAWPSQRSRGEQTLAAMVALGERLVARGGQYRGRGASAGDHARSGRSDYAAAAGAVTRGGRAGRSRCRGWRSWWPPARWRPRSTTPTARPWGRTAYNLLGPEYVNRDLAAYSDGRVRRRVPGPLHAAPAQAADAAVPPGRRARSADRGRRGDAGRRRTAGDAGRVDRWPTA